MLMLCRILNVFPIIPLLKRIALQMIGFMTTIWPTNLQLDHGLVSSNNSIQSNTLLCQVDQKRNSTPLTSCVGTDD